VFVVCKHFQPGLIFVSKTRSLSLRGALRRFSSRVGCGLNCNYKTRLGRLAWDKGFSLFGLFISDDENKFYHVDLSHQSYKTLSSLLKKKQDKLECLSQERFYCEA